MGFPSLKVRALVLLDSSDLLQGLAGSTKDRAGWIRGVDYPPFPIEKVASIGKPYNSVDDEGKFVRSNKWSIKAVSVSNNRGARVIKAISRKWRIQLECQIKFI